MIINRKTGQIAYHSLLLQENGGLKFVQYDYDGIELNRNINRLEEDFISPDLLKTNN